MEITLPPELASYVEQVAKHSNTSPEAALIEGMQWYYTSPVPVDKQAELDKLQTLSDTQLWAIVYQRLSPEDQQQLDTLLEENQQGQLPTSKQHALDNLVAKQNYQILLRSEALVILKQRGRDIESYRHSA